MRRTRWTIVIACFTVAALLAWAGSDLSLRYRGWTPAITPWAAAVAVLLSLVVLVCGLAVRRLRAHEDTWITPTGAALVAVAAQASALVGAVVAGLYAGELLTALVAEPSPAMTQLARSATPCMVAGVVWSGIGLLVEHWCAIDSSEDDDHKPSGSTPPSEATA